MTQPDINSPELMNLRQAAIFLFNDAKKVRALKTEIDNKRLSVTKIANTFYVTKHDLQEMVTLCRAPKKAPGSVGEKTIKSGLSETEASYCQIWCLRFFHQAATWLFSISSIPSLNLTPVMTLAK